MPRNRRLGRASVDPVIERTAETIRTRSARREAHAVDLIGATYRAGLETFLGKVKHSFHEDSQRREKADGSAEEVWDALTAKQSDTLNALVDDFAIATDTAEEDASSDLEDLLTSAAGDGFDEQRWMLSQLGIDDAPPEALKVSHTAAWLTAGFAGLTILDRLHTWRDTYAEKVRQQLAVGIIQERTLPETLEGLQLVVRAYQSHVDDLVGHELQRMYAAGADYAADQYADQVDGYMWLTRRDKRVCAICAPLDGVVTHLIPGDDSHPGCRCVKVPVKVDAEGKAIGYDTFREQTLAAG